MTRRRSVGQSSEYVCSEYSPPRKPGDFLLPDSAFANGLNVPGVFTGTILNRENFGTASPTTEKLVTRWNNDNPDNQVSFSASELIHSIPIGHPPQIRHGSIDCGEEI